MTEVPFSISVAKVGDKVRCEGDTTFGVITKVNRKTIAAKWGTQVYTVMEDAVIDWQPKGARRTTPAAAVPTAAAPKPVMVVFSADAVDFAKIVVSNDHRVTAYYSIEQLYFVTTSPDSDNEVRVVAIGGGEGPNNWNYVDVNSCKVVNVSTTLPEGSVTFP